MTESEAALRGYRSPRRVREERARKAGRASGVKRRRMADPAQRRRQARELALNFRVRLINRAEFDRRDYARRLRAGIEPNERGTETLWQEYCSCVRAFRAQGQGFLTTNGQRAEALRKAGRPRCGRTVRRAHASLAEMGLLRRFHDRRGGARPGCKDRIRVQFAPSFVPPPSAASTAPQSGAAVEALTASGRGDCAIGDRRLAKAAPPPRVRPPTGGSHDGRQAAGNGSNEEEVANAVAGRPGARDLDAVRQAAREAAEERGEGVPGFLRARGGDGR